MFNITYSKSYLYYLLVVLIWFGTIINDSRNKGIVLLKGKNSTWMFVNTSTMAFLFLIMEIIATMFITRIMIVSTSINCVKLYMYPPNISTVTPIFCLTRMTYCNSMFNSDKDWIKWQPSIVSWLASLHVFLDTCIRGYSHSRTLVIQIAHNIWFCAL